ncbi:MAG: PIN domain-containing protein [Verrucomicrobia bacterium]|nr:PIN domain-containing protein [Verrucomicrobiota bacterium]
MMHFIDTNILLYALSTDPEEAAKAATALDLLDQPSGALSVQVLQEFYVQATRDTKADRITHDQAVALITSWERFKVQEVTLQVLQAAFRTKKRFRVSYWDAAIIEAARAVGSNLIYSEDLNDGQDFDGVRVENPFR